MQVLGIDVGGSGIKGAPVDCKTGKLVEERLRIETPSPATPKTVFKTIKQIVNHFEWMGSIGCGFPAVISNNIVKTASNIDKKWLDVDILKHAKYSGMVFTTEIIMMSLINGCKILEFPIRLHDRKIGKSRVKRLKFLLNFLSAFLYYFLFLVLKRKHRRQSK